MTTLRDNIQRLVDRKLVRRVANPQDGRSYLLKPTARGNAILKAADPLLLDAYLRLERRLPSRREAYERFLDELATGLVRTLESLQAQRAATGSG